MQNSILYKHYTKPLNLISVVMVLICGLCTSSLSLAQDNKIKANDLFFEASLKVTTAEKFLLIKDYKSAWKEYSSALKYYQSIQLTHPLWKPAVIKYKVDSTSKKLEELQPKLKKAINQERANAAVVLENQNKLVPDLENIELPRELREISNKISIFEKDLRTSKHSYEKEREKLTKQLNQTRAELVKWANNNHTNKEKVQVLKAEIKKTEALIQGTRHYQKVDQNAITKHLTKLKKDLAKQTESPVKEDLDRAKVELEKRNFELSIVSTALVKSKQEAKFYKNKYNKISLDLKDAQKETTKLNNDLKEQANYSNKLVKSLYEKLEKSEENEKLLKKELSDAKNMVAELSEKLDQQFSENKRLQGELQHVTEERNRLQELIQQDADERIKSLAKHNIELMQNYREAQETLSRVSKDHNENLDRVQRAETDLAIAKKRILDQQAKAIKDNQRIQTLSAQVQEIRNRSTSRLGQPNLTALEIEENEILRQTARKYQVREQFYRNKLELLKEHHIKVNNDPIAIALLKNTLTRKELKLTNKELKLIEKKQIADATLYRENAVSSSSAKSTLAKSEREVSSIYNVVENMFQRESYEGAQDLLLYANEILPNKFPTLLHLGTTSLKMDKLREAEKYFKDGIIMRKNNPFIHYQLGLCQFYQGKEELASKSLKFALELDASIEKAEYYLGVINGKAGKVDEAIWHFEKSIKLNPELADAYYSLSVAFWEKQNLKQAEKYYQQALEKGYLPNQEHVERLEQLSNLNG